MLHAAFGMIVNASAPKLVFEDYSLNASGS